MGESRSPAASPNSERNLRKRFLIDPSGTLSLKCRTERNKSFRRYVDRSLARLTGYVGRSLGDRHARLGETCLHNASLLRNLLSVSPETTYVKRGSSSRLNCT